MTQAPERLPRPLRQTQGPDYTEGERILDQFCWALDGQRFNYNVDDGGKLRRYRCPHCDQSTTTVAMWHCEQCGEWFDSNSIDNQVNKPDSSIPYEIADFLWRAFEEILYGADPRDALRLKAGKRRTTQSQYYLQRGAAYLVHDRIGPYTSMTKACEDVAGELADRVPKSSLDGRTVARWYKKFYPAEND